MEAAQAETQSALNAQRAELNALSAALTAFVSGPPQAAVLPDTSILLDTLGPPLRESVRQEIQPLLEEAQRHIEEMLTARDTEISTNVASKMVSTLRAVQTIKTWMDGIIRTTSIPAVPAATTATHYNPSPMPHASGVPLQAAAGVRASSS